MYPPLFCLRLTPDPTPIPLALCIPLETPAPNIDPTGLWDRQGERSLHVAGSSVYCWIMFQEMREELKNSEADAEMYMKFMKSHCCYEAIPTSCKLVIFDTTLQNILFLLNSAQIFSLHFPRERSWSLLVKKAFFALVANGLRAAPLWDSKTQRFVGMLTITDFINILHRYYRSPLVQMNELERHQIGTWRGDSFKCVPAILQPLSSQYRSRRQPLRRHLFPTEKETVPKPCFMQKTIQDVGIGTFRNIATVQQTASVYDALSVFVERRVSALPVVNEQGKVVALYSRFDVINLAAQKTYNNLNMSMQEAIRRRCCFIEGVIKCLPDETLETVIDRIIKAEVHRLVLVDKEDVCRGIISLSDLLQAMVLSPAGIDALLAPVGVRPPCPSSIFHRL
ncbi:5'-AMP-activated protein kinase subunit gamma-1-like isoform X6 [Oncorhynchus nerka]|uniref:5'-AMP-activated protein kinase subunit gamma-1-like isoform X6 n=1 Tax=Oncorhynchus nerka TaxID=8023 RepID=UPI0031B893C8